MVSKEEALAELQARGIDPSNPPAHESNVATVDKRSAIEELKRRGIDIPVTQPQEKSILGFGKNVISDLMQNLVGMGSTIKAGAYDLPMALAKSPVQMAQGTPLSQTDIGQQVSQFANNSPQMAKDMAQPVLDPINYSYKHPVSQGLNIAALGGLAAKVPAAVDAVTPDILSNLTKSANPEILKASQESGVPLTAAGLTGSKTQAQIEGFLSRLPFSGDVMQGKFAEQLSKLKDLREPLIAEAKPAEDLGLEVQDAFKRSSEDAYRGSQNDYSTVNKFAPKGQIKASVIQDISKPILDSQMALPSVARSQTVAPWLKELSGQNAVEAALKKAKIDMTPPSIESEVPSGGNITPEKQNYMNILKQAQQGMSDVQKHQKIKEITNQALEEHGYSYSQLQGMRKQINQAIADEYGSGQKQTMGVKYQATPDAAILEQLKSAIDSDIASHVKSSQNVQYQNAFEKANANYADYKSIYKDNKFIKSILNEQNPVNVVMKATKLNDPQALDILKENLPPPVLDDLKSAFIKNMSESKPDEFSPSHLVTKYERLGEDKLAQFLGPEIMQKLKPIYQLSKASLTAEKIAGNPSGTGQALGSMMGLWGPIRELLNGNPVKAATFAAAEASGLPAMARMYNSEIGTKLMTRQPNAVTNTLGNINRMAGNATIPLAAKAGTNLSQQNVQDLIEQLKQKYAQRRKM